MENAKGVLDYEMEQVAIELQHVNVKLFVKHPESVDLEAVVPVFHAWIQGQIFDELLLDVADYSHVPDGPGVVLIGHEADYSLDNTDGRLGVRYNRKARSDGTNHDRLVQATRAALIAFQRLEGDFDLGFNQRELEFIFNDRLHTPNTEATRSSTDTELRTFLSRLLGGAGYALTHPSDPRSLFEIKVVLDRTISIQQMLTNLDMTTRV